MSGAIPIRSIRRGTIQKIKTRFEATPRKANQVVALFRILLKLAVDREYLSTNPAAEPEMLATPARVQIWTHEDEDEFLDAALPSIRLAFLLMLYTIQRPSDVLAMSRNHVSDKRGRLWIALRQQKTAQLLDVPVHARLEGPMRERLEEKTSLLLVPSPTVREGSHGAIGISAERGTRRCVGWFCGGRAGSSSLAGQRSECGPTRRTGTVNERTYVGRGSCVSQRPEPPRRRSLRCLAIPSTTARGLSIPIYRAALRWRSAALKRGNALG